MKSEIRILVTFGLGALCVAHPTVGFSILGVLAGLGLVTMLFMHVLWGGRAV